MKVRVQRQSVCFNEDVEAPHERIFDVSDDITVASFLRHIGCERYLPPIAGGRATWLLEGTEPLAVVATEYAEPWFLASSDARLLDTLPPAEPFVPAEKGLPLTFLYFAQQSPEKIYRRFGGDPAKLPMTAKAPALGLPKASLLQRLLFPWMHRP